MNRFCGIALRFAGVMLVASSAFAQDKQAVAPAAMEMPPHPAMQQLNAFLGNWECSGKAFTSSFGPEHATKATVTIAPQLDGHWITVTYTEAKSKDNPMAMATVEQWGYDPGQRMFVSGIVDNMGGYTTEATKGWSGDMLVWEGVAHTMGLNMKSRDTFTKSANGAITHAGEMETQKGWEKLDEETCTKKK